MNRIKSSDRITPFYKRIRSFIYTISYWIVFSMLVVNFVRFSLLAKAYILLGRMPHLEDSFRTAIKPRLFSSSADEIMLLVGALTGYFILPVVLFFFILLKNYRGIFITIILLAVEILFWNIDGSKYLMDFN